MAIYKSSDNVNRRDRSKKSIFLAGSIENGTAVDWQSHCEQELGQAYNLFNPRAGYWDEDWKPESKNVFFARQVNWELDGLAIADIVLMNFASGTKSPISLLEFGLMAASKKMMVVCPPDFWKKGNIDMVCQRYDIPQFDQLDQAIKALNEFNH